MTGRSNAWRFPVEGPAGRTLYLTGLQWQLYWTVRHLRDFRGQWTLARFSELTGSSRGRCWHALARLRSLDLIGFRAWPVMERDPDRTPRRYSPGRLGRLLLWLPRRLQLARGPARAGSPAGSHPTRIDSVSTPSGRFLTRDGLSRAFARDPDRWRPPGPGSDAGTGPRRGRPPRVLWSRCPAGHRVHLQRRTWTVRRATVSGVFEGRCGRCGQDSREAIELRRLDPARPLTPAEVADPGLFAGRAAAAAAVVAAEAGPLELREVLHRDYLDPERPRAALRPGPQPAGRLAAAWAETLRARQEARP